MNRPRFTYAAKQGLKIAVGVTSIATGLAALRRHEPPWLTVLLAAVAFGLVYLALVYFEVGPVRTDV